MGIDIPTLPASIPGLLRRGSPVVATKRTHAGVPAGHAGIAVVRLRRAVWSVAWHPYSGPSPAQQSVIGLDLTDATGRAHAAWWLAEHGTPSGICDFFEAAGIDPARFPAIIEPAGSGDPVSNEDMDMLRRVCLHVAGRPD